MNSAIWTVILLKSGKTISSHEYSSREPDLARQEIQKRYPYHDVLALVLGRHMSTYVFSQTSTIVHEAYDSEGNQPTGGSD